MQLSISTIDTAIIAIYVVLTLMLGLYLGRNAKDLSSFLVGGRNLPWYAVLGSIIATETSAVTFLSIPGITYRDGGDFSFLQVAIGFLVGRLMVVTFMLGRYFQGNLFTAYDVLHQRFGGRTGRTASLIFMITRTVGDGLRLYLTAIVLEKVTAIGIGSSITLIATVTIIYAGFGGIRSVIWNDCIQLIVYLTGAVAALWVISESLPGGFEEIIAFGHQQQKWNWLDIRFSFTTANFWAGLIGGCFISLATHGTDQMMVQRYLCSRSRHGAAWAVGLSGPIVLAQFALFLVVGVALSAYYHHHGSLGSHASDEVLAGFVVDEMPIGLCGLTLAAVFSVAMSTLSSSLSSSASAVVNDFLKPQMERKFRGEQLDQRLTRASRWWTAVFGVLQLGVGLIVASTPALESPSVINQVIAIAGLTSGLILGIFLLGMSKRSFDERSLLVGMALGFLITMVVVFAPELVPETVAWKIHSWWAAVVASLTTLGLTYFVDVFYFAKHSRNPFESS